jgi:glycosyltransferase involved in cell wall biosynthesis
MAVADTATGVAAAGAKKRRVLHTYKIYKPEGDGGVPAVISVLTALASPETENEVLTARRRGWIRRFNDGATPVTAVSSLGDLSSLPIAPSFPFWVIARARKNDILVHHVPFPLTDFAIAAFGLPKRTALIVYWHAEIVGRPLLKRLLTPILHRALTRADAIIVSDEVMAANSPFLRRVAQKCVAIPYGIDTAYWRSLDDDARTAVAKLRENHPRLIAALGRLVPYKGYDVLLQAMTRVGNAHLIIAGDGPLRDRLAYLARDLKIADRVTFVGRLPRAEIKTVVHAAGVFVMPSNTIAEAFGLAQVEAMAAGLPVVNTDLPTTVPKVARHNLEGLTVPPNDAAALASALQTLLDDRTLAARLGRAAQARAASEYDQDVFVRRVENLYQELAQADVLRPKTR